MIGGQEMLSQAQRANDIVVMRDGSLAPVDALGGLRAALSDSLREHAAGTPYDDTPPRLGARKATAGRAPGEDRRKEDRRKARLPTPLDTRTYQRRRSDRERSQPGHPPPINVEI